MQNYENSFSWESLTRIVIMGVVVFLCWRALGALPVILVALVLAMAFYPVIKKVQNKTKIPLILCIFLILIIPLALIVYLGFLYVPRIIAAVPMLLGSLDYIVSHSEFLSSLLKDFNLISYVQSHFDYANATVSITFVFFSIITTIFLTFFLIYDFEKLFDLFLHVVPKREKTKIKELSGEVALVVGRFIRGSAVLAVFSCVIIFVGLSFLSVPFALPLAIFAAIFGLLPIVGQTIGSVPAIIIGLGVSPLTGLFVFLLNIIYQQIQNSLISPIVYNKSLNLIPSISFLSVILGGSLFGIIGAFLALPVAASIPAIIDYHKNYKIRNDDL